MSKIFIDSSDEKIQAIIEAANMLNLNFPDDLAILCSPTIWCDVELGVLQWNDMLSYDSPYHTEWRPERLSTIRVSLEPEELKIISAFENDYENINNQFSDNIWQSESDLIFLPRCAYEKHLRLPGFHFSDDSLVDDGLVGDELIPANLLE